MTCSMKLMKVFTILRTLTDSEKVPIEQYEKILGDPKIQAEFVHTFRLVLAGKLKVTLDNSEVTFNGEVISKHI